MRNSQYDRKSLGDIVGYSRAVRVGNLVFVSGTTAVSRGTSAASREPGPQDAAHLDRIDAALANSEPR